MSNKDVDLKDLVQAVRRSLEELDAERSAAQQSALFELESLELELHFAVATQDNIRGKFDLKIVSIGSDLGSREEKLHKIKVRFRVAPGAIKSGVPGTRGHSSTTVGSEGVRPLGEPKEIEEPLAEE